MNRRRLWACALSASGLIASAGPSTQDRFPERKGKAELLKVCSGCHEAEIVLAHQLTMTEWSKTLSNMAQLGAAATDEESRAVEEYIDAQFAIVKVNAATVEEVQRTFDVTPALAQAVVKDRQERGPFTSIEDLKRVPGLGTATVEARKDRLIF
jgi:competence ComEA-like helix-hairpin-helix protein